MSKTVFQDVLYNIHGCNRRYDLAMNTSTNFTQGEVITHLNVREMLKGQGVSATLQYFIMMLFCHTFSPN